LTSFQNLNHLWEKLSHSFKAQQVIKSSFC
jgi:hypothetical protein